MPGRDVRAYVITAVRQKIATLRVACPDETSGPTQLLLYVKR
jgi:hypothetical protein